MTLRESAASPRRITVAATRPGNNAPAPAQVSETTKTLTLQVIIARNPIGFDFPPLHGCNSESRFGEGVAPGTFARISHVADSAECPMAERD
jgi:hypothetical protein